MWKGSEAGEWEDENFPGAFGDLKKKINKKPLCFENSIKRNVLLQKNSMKEESKGFSKVNHKKNWFGGWL